AVFEIPLIDPSMNNPNPHPGLIVFELTPLGGIKDRLERKLAVLEDCRRLKGILGELAEYRYFIPSVLFIHWAE
ncbi:hypothetical protein EV360DRAFT_6439, partial [Lentinula raphanica]